MLRINLEFLRVQGVALKNLRAVGLAPLKRAKILEFPRINLKFLRMNLEFLEIASLRSQ